MPGDAADAAQGGAVGLPDTSQREAPPTARLGTVEPTELEAAAVSGVIASAERLSVESPGYAASRPKALMQSHQTTCEPLLLRTCNRHQHVLTRRQSPATLSHAS